MRRALKVIIPLVLILALLAAGCWYFLFQRPDLTSGFLLNQAEIMVQSGRYDRAITYYSWAWSLEPERDDIPIDLADTYISAGNYTKAEYTLVKAITNHPQMTKLYAALSRTYVAQDKLLDAVQMLDRTTDPVVKAELDLLRPAAPVILPESGYYNEYVDISVQYDSGNVYVSFDGSYPSALLDPFTDTVKLNSGETTVLAVSVDDQGLVSPLTKNGYTIGGVIEEITLSDAAIDQAVRELLMLDADDKIMSDTLWSITTLYLPSTVEDLNDLRLFTGLQSLTVQNVSGMDFTILNQIPSLQELNLSGCTISSNAMEAIGSLSELKKLALSGCALTDINAFSRLTKLKELDLSNNILEDVGVLSLMLDLESVNLANNPLSSIAGLSTCSNLKYVDITGCSVGSLGALAAKTELETLLAADNNLDELDDIVNCTSLKVLNVNNNQVEDIAVVALLPNLEHFSAENNAITTLPAFDAGDCRLVYFDVDGNQIEDVSVLAGIDTLNYLQIDYNQVTDLLPLADNRNLVQVNAWDNAISEESVEALGESSIILNYNPNFVDPDAEEETEES